MPATAPHLGLPTGRWTAPRLAEVLHEAVHVRGWPAASASRALLAVAADPATRSPMRLACPGPWWDTDEPAPHAQPATGHVPDELATLEARLGEVGGLRVPLQPQARRELATQRIPITRLTVARRACQLLDRS
jgi:hypothetical protein